MNLGCAYLIWAFIELDNSGSWGHGGLFSAIDQINPDISIDYLKASEMEDLKLGDCHVWPLKSNINVTI